jgi:1-acyl-sn-glycerol-3-phosphate acyltransferase
VREGPDRIVDRTYRWLRSLARVALSFYYEEVEVHGAEQVPADGPLLMLANHQISLVDPVLLAHAVPRHLRVLAKAPLFRIPVLSFVMRSIGSIPVQRREDSASPGWLPPGSRPAAPAAPGQGNAPLYDALAQALIDGGVIGIFPEGVSHDNPMLGPFRHGAARIALEAESRASFCLGLKVQLVGIHIEESRLFRGRVLLNFSAPFTLESEEAAYRADPRAAVEALTGRMRERLTALVLEAEDHEDLQLAGIIESLEVLPAGEPGLHGTFARKKLILEQYRTLRASHPAQVHLIRELLVLYRDALEFQPPAAAPGAATGRLWLAKILGLVRQAGVVTPAIALGVAANALPFVTVRILAIVLTRLQRRGQDVRASLGIMFGVPIFLGWYAVLTWAAVTSSRIWLWGPLLVAAPFAGLAAVSRLAAWKQSVRKLLVACTSFLTRGKGESTERLRALLREHILRLYETTRTGGAP